MLFSWRQEGLGYLPLLFSQPLISILSSAPLPHPYPSIPHTEYAHQLLCKDLPDLTLKATKIKSMGDYGSIAFPLDISAAWCQRAVPKQFSNAASSRASNAAENYSIRLDANNKVDNNLIILRIITWLHNGAISDFHGTKAFLLYCACFHTSEILDLCTHLMNLK